MTYLSRIRLNPTRRGTQKLLASPQAMHAAVMGSHPRFLDDRVSGRVLWRIDQPAKHDIQVYVVSPVTPDFTGLLEQAGWPTQPKIGTARNTSHFLTCSTRVKYGVFA